MDYIIREILEEEYSLLEKFLYEAIFVPEGIYAPPKAIIAQPELQVYVTDFGKKRDDIGLVAEVATKVVGAVWVRKWSGQIVKDYTIQGWSVDKERHKKGNMFTDEYINLKRLL